MKKMILILLAGVILSGCYTTLYPPANMDMSAANNIPDSTRQVVINNYYETTEYYQVPHYQRYSLLWGSYYWDPFYYDYDYYHWRPYYWYGHYYYYNPHNHYWYYYDHHYPWHRGSGNWTGGGSGSNNGNKERVHKPGYNVLTTTSGLSKPFVSVNSDNSGRVTKPVKKVGINVNSDVSNNDGYYSSSNRVQSVGKKPVSSSTSSGSSKTYKSSSNKSSSTVYKQGKVNSSSSTSRPSSSGSKSSKSSSTSSTSSKNSRSESSSSSSKKSK